MDKTIEEAEQEPQATSVVDSDALIEPLHPQTSSHVLQSALRWLALLLVFLFLDSIAPIFPSVFLPTVTVTLVPAVHTVTLQSNVPLGRLTDPITLSQSQTARASGHGHQDAKQATGTITLYNGLTSPQDVVAGTILTGADGIIIATDTSVSVPPDNPPRNGVATVQAHALPVGTHGNIPAGDIQTSLAAGLYAQNLSPFTGGQDERDFRIVEAQDINGVVSNLKAKVRANMNAALNSELLTGEKLEPEPCAPTVSADHDVGQEATQVTVTVSETCQAIVYDGVQLQTQATRLLTARTTKQYGQGYVLSAHANVTVTGAATNTKTVVLSFTATGIYAYQLTAKQQQRLKKLLAGKPRLIAFQLLTHLAGIEQVSINGIADNQQLPDIEHIHLLIVLLISA